MLSAIEWILLGAASAAAVVTGVRRHRPARIGPWVLLGASLVSLAIGDVFYAFDQQDAADLCYTVMYVLVALSLIQLTRGGSVLVDRARLIDLVAFACSSLLVVWVFVLGKNGTLGKISAADVLGDVLLVGVAARLIVASWRNWSAILLGVGAVGVLTGAIVYPIREDWIGEIGFMVLYIAWGAAALHPSMVELTEPAHVSPTPWKGRWATLLAVSVATPPIVLLIETVTTGVTDGVVIAAAGAITLALTFTRLGDALRQHSAALTRERGLREASAALVAAADLPAVDEAVRLAVAQLLPGGVRKIVFATDNRQLALAQVALPVAGEALTPARKTFWKNRQATRTVRDAPSANRGGPSAVGEVPSANREVPPTARDGLPAARDGLPTDSDDPPAARDGQPADREALSPARAEALPVSAEALPTARDGRSANRDARPAAEVVRSADRGGRPQSGPSPRSWWASPPAGPGLDDTLVCPLWLEPLAVARPSGGALVLTGGREMLTAARDTLEVLAGQAALALDRISLVEAVGRRDSDLYLRAVIRNTPDAMLVIDSDQRIRYASPALRAMLGLEELPPLATLHDLVHPNDRSQVRQALETEGDGVVFCALQRPDESQVLVEATYRDLREDRLVQGFVVTMRNVTKGHEPGERLPHLEHQDELPAWVNRRSAQHKFRY